MIHNVRAELLATGDMSMIALLQNYPKQTVDIESLALTARQIQRGLIRFDLITDNKELYSVVDGGKMADYAVESAALFHDVRDFSTFPPQITSNRHHSHSRSMSMEDDFWDYLSGPDIRIPGP